MINKRVVGILLASSMLGTILFVVRSFVFDSLNYWYLNWNLFLAWIPLVLVYLLKEYASRQGTKTLVAVLLAVLFVGFLPNTFYIATDLIHLQDASDRTLFFDMAMLLQFTLSGFWIGCVSLYEFHMLLRRTVKTKYADVALAICILLSGYAIYLGRFLRWNSWDIVTNPVGLVYDVSERFINPSAHQQTYATTLLFAAIISTSYGLFWATMRAYTVRPSKPGHNR